MTPDVIRNGRRTVTVKRICDGCGDPLGDATTEELEAAIMGRLPSVIEECGCEPEPPYPGEEPCDTPGCCGSGACEICPCCDHGDHLPPKPPIEKIDPAATPQEGTPTP